MRIPKTAQRERLLWMQGWIYSVRDRALIGAAILQVMDVKGTAEAVQLLKEQQARDGAPGVDLILKEHDPPAANACRLLRRILEDDVLRTIPVVGAARACPDGSSA